MSCFRANRAARHLASVADSTELSFSFSGGGFLMPYFLGVVEVLKGLGLIKPGVTHVAGSSAGSLVAVGVSCGLDNGVLFDSLLSAGSECAPGVRGRLGAALHKQLERVLPQDAHLKCNGVAHIGITRLSTSPLLKSKIISEFNNREDLIQALLASCHIPILSDGKMVTKFRGKSAMDGGLTALIPSPPSQPHHKIIKVSCLSRPIINRMPLLNRKAALRGFEQGIAPGLFKAWPHTLDETFKFALNPQPREFLLALMESGKEDAQAWVAASGWESRLSGRPQVAIEAAGPDPASPVAVTQARHDETALAQGTSTDAAKVLGQSTTLAIQATEGSGGLPEQKTGDKG